MGGGGRIVLSLMSGDVVLASCLNNHASFLLLFTKRVFYIYIYIYIQNYCFCSRWCQRNYGKV